MWWLRMDRLYNMHIRCLPASGKYTNPIKEPNGSDPFMVYSNGYYYLMTTTWTNIQITRATTINGLKTATPKVVYSESTPDRCCNWWAPEIHWQPKEGAWYIYYSAGPRDAWERAHALKGSSADIWNSTWTYAGAPAPPNRSNTSLIIDGTVLVLNDVRYFVFSSWDTGVTGFQCLFLSKMTSATTLGDATKISCPDKPWEQIGNNVQEGPAVLQRGNRTWIVYSASFCSGTGYKLGRLELTGSDPLLASSWTKYENPIFTSGNGLYQPGHNGFFKSPSGAQIYNVFHANHESPGKCDGSRFTNVALVYWNADGTPNLGSPPALSSNLTEPW
ncbi:hypothetical protein AX16_007920 [Volvariella volvacea WC 439]|nr:hypothetical protein AX16_008567 [Volvariella volvacea WC 439]KAF8645305.1 hypothetical protein AX16_007920 [Volvariella volvacea WC 439]